MAEVPPSFLLQARYVVVPFRGRTAELAEVAAWCHSSDVVSTRLVTGPGGSGKTRFAAEIRKRLVDRGWLAGFLQPDEGAKGLTTSPLYRVRLPWESIG
jgi:tetraacyldisaccharide-1-P 4'-kinase